MAQSSQPSREDSQRKEPPATLKDGRRKYPGHGKRGPDREGRGRIALHYLTLLNDDGTLERSLEGDTSFVARMMRSYLKAADDPKLAIELGEKISDRLEGKPVQKIQAVDPQPLTVVLQQQRSR